MASGSSPRVLIVDDHPDDVRSLAISLEGVDVTFLHPNDVMEDDLADSEVVLIDYLLDEWPERENTSQISFRPLDGLALAGVLKANAYHQKDSSPTAFAIYSAHLKDLTGGLPPEYREHVIARAINLEWAFGKFRAPGAPSLETQLSSLAHAVRSLPETWPRADPESTQQQFSNLLGLNSDWLWYSDAVEDVDKCNPPIRDLFFKADGMVLVRWLLHRILPYPCFLLDVNHLASRLRVTVDSLQHALNHQTELHARVDAFRYAGILSDFAGDRWWRSGGEAFLWELTDGNPFDLDHLRSSLDKLVQDELVFLQFAQPVVCHEENLRALPELYDIEQSVRIQLDDWPVFADKAWAPIQLAQQNPELGSLVVPEDRSLLQQTG